MIIEACIRAPVLLNLLDTLGKTDKMLGTASHLILSPTRLINSVIHEHSCKVVYIEKFQKRKFIFETS